MTGVARSGGDTWVIRLSNVALATIWGGRVFSTSDVGGCGTAKARSATRMGENDGGRTQWRVGQGQALGISQIAFRLYPVVAKCLS
jgi:hypothetical protein